MCMHIFLLIYPPRTSPGHTSVHVYMQDIPTLGFGINWGGVDGEVSEACEACEASEGGLGDLTGLSWLG